jgi:CBS domain-containing protein
MKNIEKSISTIKHSVRVRDIMTVKVFLLDKEDRADKAVRLMAENKISTIVICEKKKPIGVVTERDMIKKQLFREKNPKKTKLKEIMSINPATIGQDDTILKASDVMKKKEVRKLVVVNNKGELLCIISQTDIIRSMNKIYSSYSHLLWNPWLAIAFFILVTVLFILNGILFRK